MKTNIYFQVVVIPMLLVLLSALSVVYININSFQEMKQKLIKQKEQEFLQYSEKRLKEMIYVNVDMLDNFYKERLQKIKEWMKNDYFDKKAFYNPQTKRFLQGNKVPQEVLESTDEFVVIKKNAYLKIKKDNVVEILIKDISSDITVVKKEALHIFNSYEPAKETYLFILEFFKNDPSQARVIHSLIKPLNGEVLKGNLVYPQKPDFKKQIFNLIKEKNEGFLEYWITVQTQTQGHRYSYFYYYEPFNWVLGRSVSMYDMQQQINTLTNQLDTQMQTKQKKTVTIIVLTVLIALVLTFLIAREIAKKLNHYHTKLDTLNNSLEERVKLKTKELRELNQNLENEIQRQLDALRQKDVQLLQQSKLLSMKELMSNIAHQWRQPLNALSIEIQMLEDDYEDGLIDEKYVQEFTQKNYKKLQQLSVTIDNFKNFFKDSTQKEIFSVKEAVINALEILEGLVKELGITVELSSCDECEIEFYKSEFEQILLSVLTNSKDAFVKNEIQNPKISLYISCKDATTIEIVDNAGGIDEKLIDKVFEPYTTTKFQAAGTGLGLYMAKSILTNENADITCQNYKNGVKTVIIFKSEDIKDGK